MTPGVRELLTASAGLAAALAAGGCGGSSSGQKSVATVATPTAKSAPTHKSRRHAHVKQKTSTAKSTPSATAKATPKAHVRAAPAASPKVATPPTIPIPAARSRVAAPRKWSGNGNDTLGTIALARDAVVHWTVSGGRFALTDRTGKLKISGKGTTGQSFAASGTYSAVKVTASGTWTLSIASLGA